MHACLHAVLLSALRDGSALLFVNCVLVSVWARGHWKKLYLVESAAESPSPTERPFDRLRKIITPTPTLSLSQLRG
jgi:hypothetical protein